MLKGAQFVEALNDYSSRLRGLLGAFVRHHNSISLNSEDEALARQTIQELSDLFNDNVPNNTYSIRVAHIASEGICGYPARVSKHCVQELLSLVLAVKARTERNLGAQAQEIHVEQTNETYWQLLHPTVVALAKSRIKSGHHADGVEACFKELNNVVKEKHHRFTGQELDGVDLMRKAFKLDSPSITLCPLLDETGKNIQRGYLDLFAGAMAGIRNPKAHGNVLITKEQAIHFLFLASLLFDKLDKST